MDIFLAVCVNMNGDDWVRPFSTKEKAIDFAWKFAQKNTDDPEDCYVMEPIRATVIWMASYGGPGEWVYVEMETLDNERQP